MTSSKASSSSRPARHRKRSKPPAASLPELKCTSLTELATPASSVSAFCQAVISKVIPDGFWGEKQNKSCFLKKVHHFIHLRRFESMCLHEVMQGMKVRTAPVPHQGSMRPA